MEFSDNILEDFGDGNSCGLMNYSYSLRESLGLLLSTHAHLQPLGLADEALLERIESLTHLLTEFHKQYIFETSTGEVVSLT